VWADTLLVAERAHLHILLLWGGTGMALGLLIIATVGRLRRSSLLVHFGAQCVLWGAIESLYALVALRSLVLRDLGGATQLDRLLWLNVGFDTGYVAVGAAVAITGWVVGRRHGALGAGAAIVVQGLALALLHATFLLQLERFV
jgi:hypothetical protein